MGNVARITEWVYYNGRIRQNTPPQIYYFPKYFVYNTKNVRDCPVRFS